MSNFTKISAQYIAKLKRVIKNAQRLISCLSEKTNVVVKIGLYFFNMRIPDGNLFSSGRTTLIKENRELEHSSERLNFEQKSSAKIEASLVLVWLPLNNGSEISSLSSMKGTDSDMWSLQTVDKEQSRDT